MLGIEVNDTIYSNIDTIYSNNATVHVYSSCLHVLILKKLIAQKFVVGINSDIFTNRQTDANSNNETCILLSLVWPDSIFRIVSGASLNINLCFQCFDLHGHEMLISISTLTSQGMDYGVAGFINYTNHSTCYHQEKGSSKKRYKYFQNFLLFLAVNTELNTEVGVIMAADFMHIFQERASRSIFLFA